MQQFQYRRLMWCLVGATALLAACGGGGSEPSSPAPAPAPSPAPAPPAPAPAPVPAPPPAPAPVPVRQANLAVIVGEEGAPGPVGTDGIGRGASLLTSSIAVDPEGNAWIGGRSPSGASLRRVTPDGVVTTPPLNGPNDCSIGASDVATAADGTLYYVAAGGVCRRSPAGVIAFVTLVPETPTALAAGPANEVYIGTDGGRVYRVGLLGPEAIPAAPFQPIVSMAVDAAGTIYVADHGGVHALDTRGGRRLLVARPATQFMRQIAAEPSGSLVTVLENSIPGTSAAPVLRRISPTGVVTPVVGGDDLFRWGQLVDVAVDRQGRIVYASGQGVGRLAPDGAHTAVAGHGLAGPHAPVAESPLGVDAAGGTWTITDLAPWLSALDAAQPLPLLRRYDAAGRRLPFAAGRPELVISERPSFSAVDADGHLVLVYARFVQEPTGLPIFRRGAPIDTEIYRVAPDGGIRQLYRRAAADAGFVAVMGFGIDAQGRMIVGDAVTNTIRWLRPDGSSERLGPGLFADVNGGAAMAVAPSGRVALWQANGLYRLDANGDLRRWTGQGFQTNDVADGPASTARIAFMSSLAFDSAGQFWFTDRNTLRTVAEDGSVATVVGRPEAAWNTPGAWPATIASPQNLQAGPDRTLVVRSLGAILRIVLP